MVDGGNVKSLTGVVDILGLGTAEVEIVEVEERVGDVKALVEDMVCVVGVVDGLRLVGVVSIVPGEVGGTVDDVPLGVVDGVVIDGDVRMGWVGEVDWGEGEVLRGVVNLGVGEVDWIVVGVGEVDLRLVDAGVVGLVEVNLGVVELRGVDWGMVGLGLRVDLGVVDEAVVNRGLVGAREVDLAVVVPGEVDPGGVDLTGVGVGLGLDCVVELRGVVLRGVVCGGCGDVRPVVVMLVAEGVLLVVVSGNC